VTIGPLQEYSSEDYDNYREICKKDIEAHRKLMRGGAFRLNMAPRDYFGPNPYSFDRPSSSATDETTKERTKSSSPSGVKSFKPSSPGKSAAGMKAGTFDPYPTHSVDEYEVKVTRKSEESASQKKRNKVFIPPAGLKSAPINSVLYQNINRSVNVQNYKTVQSVMTY